MEYHTPLFSVPAAGSPPNRIAKTSSHQPGESGPGATQMAAPAPSVHANQRAIRPVPFDGQLPRTYSHSRVDKPVVASGVGPARSVRNRQGRLAARHTPYPPTAPMSNRTPANPDPKEGPSSPSAPFFNRPPAGSAPNHGNFSNSGIPQERTPHPPIAPKFNRTGANSGPGPGPSSTSIRIFGGRSGAAATQRPNPDRPADSGFPQGHLPYSQNLNQQSAGPTGNPALRPLVVPIPRSFERTLADPQPHPRRPAELGIPQESILMKDQHRVYWLLPSDTPFPWGSHNRKLASVPSVLQREYNERDWDYGFLPSLKNISPRGAAEQQKAQEPRTFSCKIYGFTYPNLVPEWPGLLPTPPRTSRGADLYDMAFLTHLDFSVAARRSHDEVLQRTISSPATRAAPQGSHTASNGAGPSKEVHVHGHFHPHGRHDSVAEKQKYPSTGHSM